MAFLEQSFAGRVRGQVPINPPVAPSELTLADAGGRVVNASCPLGQNLAAGTHYFRVLPRWGFFAGFPGASQTVEVA